MTFLDVLKTLKDEILEIQGQVDEKFQLTLDDTDHITSHTLNWNAKDNVLKVGDCIIKVRDAKFAIAILGNTFFVDNNGGIHRTAVIEEGAIIGKGCDIGPYVVIHKNSKIGNNVSIGSGSVIGGKGFGFVKDRDYNWLRFPQLGNVIIGDNVEIGANCTIDRGALSDTVIGNDVKINSSVHVAHNVKVGDHTIITSNVNISGSANIGKNVWIGPGVTIRDHVRIGDDAYIGIGSNVVKDIPSQEIWCGNPARFMKVKQ